MAVSLNVMNCFFREFVDDLQRVWTLCKDAQFEKPNSSDKVHALCKTAKVEIFLQWAIVSVPAWLAFAPFDSALLAPRDAVLIFAR